MNAINRLINAFRDITKRDHDFDGMADEAQSELRAMYIEKINKYYDGVKDGVYLYAWWAEGSLQVGTSGKSFSEAALQIEKDRAEALSKVSS